MSFFDKMTNALGSATKDVAQMARDASDVSKFNSLIEEDEKEIDFIYKEIGQHYYEDHPEDIDQQYLEWFGIVDRNKQEIQELKEKIRKLKGIEICPQCGAEIKKGSNFCNKCGFQVVQKEKSDMETEMRCPNCGNPLQGDEKFCANCGNEIVR